MVRLCIREARNLLGSDWNYFGFKGTSDPYVAWWGCRFMIDSRGR